MRFNHIMLAATVSAVVIILGSACADEKEKLSAPSPAPEQSPAATAASEAGDVFMTFEGRLYQAREAGSDVIESDQLELVGTTEDISVEHSGPVDVYRLKDGTNDKVYTPQSGGPPPEAGAAPANWVEWVPALKPLEGGSSGAGSTPEAGVLTTPSAATPAIQETPFEAPLGEYEDGGSPPLPGATPPPAQSDPAVGGGDSGSSLPR